MMKRSIESLARLTGTRAMCSDSGLWYIGNRIRGVSAIAAYGYLYPLFLWRTYRVPISRQRAEQLYRASSSSNPDSDAAP